MSAQPVLPLQDRILGLLQQHGGIRAKDVERYVTGVDRGAIDAALTGLLKQSRATLALGMYEVVKPGAKRPVEYLASVLPQDPPNAMAEAVASLKPQLFDCPQCPEKQPREAFRWSIAGSRYIVCKHHQAVAIAMAKARRKNLLNSPQGESSIPTTDVAPEPTSEPVVTAPQGNAGESPASNSTGPASLAEALHTVLHGPDVTPLPTSSPAFKDMLEAKRLALIVRIEEAEALVERLKSQLVELDRAVAGLRVVMPEVFA